MPTRCSKYELSQSYSTFLLPSAAMSAIQLCQRTTTSECLMVGVKRPARIVSALAPGVRSRCIVHT